jgi:hypothetical protein
MITTIQSGAARGCPADTPTAAVLGQQGRRTNSERRQQKNGFHTGISVSVKHVKQPRLMWGQPPSAVRRLFVHLSLD